MKPLTRQVGARTTSSLVHAAVAACLVTSGCAGTFEVSGGPQAVHVQVRKSKLLEDLRPLVAGDPRATGRIDAIGRRETHSKILLGAEFAMLIGCIALTSSDSLEPTTTTYTGIGFCAATIALGVATVIVTPKMSTYGQPLKLFNEDHPETPFVAPRLGVSAAPRRTTDVARTSPPTTR